MSGEWMNRGACIGIGPRLFYSQDDGDQRTAREICAACPVKDQCREWATATKQEGIWGGLDEDERQSLRRKIRKDRLNQKRYERRACDECGETFTVTRFRRVVCSDECRAERHRRASTESTRRARYRRSA